MVETEQLELIPLTAEQLGLWLEDCIALEELLHCTYEGEPVEGFFQEIVRGQYQITSQAPEHFRWHSFWFLLDKSSRKVVGSADFKDVPNAAGQVELGYGLGVKHRGHGYMVEAIGAMCTWAAQQPGVKELTAETDKDNLPSQRVLLRNGFQIASRGETIWWNRKP